MPLMSIDTFHFLRSFIEDRFNLDLSGQIPSVEDANRRESVLTLPWQEKPLELGKALIFASQSFLSPTYE